MKVWDIHVRGDRVRLVPDGLSVWGVVFGPVWLLWHRAWLSGLAVLLAAMLLHASPAAGSRLARAAGLALDVAVGLFGNDLRRAELRLGGYRETGRVAGETADHALLRDRDRATVDRASVDRATAARA